jgi:hypothetical protein
LPGTTGPSAMAAVPCVISRCTIVLTRSSLARHDRGGVIVS